MSLHRPHFNRRFLRRLAWLFVSAWALYARAADPPGPTEYQLKAAFIYNFAKFVEWPAASLPMPNSPIILGMLGDDAVGKDLSVVNGQVIGRHAIQVRRFRDVADIQGCHILFILPSERLELPAIVQALRNRNILTICEASRDFSTTGAVINLIKTPQDKIRFEINVDAAKRATLKIASPLLNLAKIVRDPQPTP